MNHDLSALTGRAWVLGDHIDTDLLAPGHAMRKPIEELSRHCLEAIAPDFATSVRRGDLLIAGEAFGTGSSREQAVEALAHLGIAAILAKSIGRIFYRNALNLGLPIARFAAADQVGMADLLRVDLLSGHVHNETKGESYSCEPMPAFLLDMLRDGGLIPHLHRRKEKRGAAALMECHVSSTVKPT